MIHCGDCKIILPEMDNITCIFADPPDNIGLKYHGYYDFVPNYFELLEEWVNLFIEKAPIVWISFNAKWTFEMGRICSELKDIKIKPCVQTFTFGQHNQHDLGNNYRPLWRFTRPWAKIYPDQIRVVSKRQLNNDKRADPRGKVPGDVFDFPRVTGNGKQRRAWHPTQLHEGLVERCILMSTLEGDMVVDPFGGTGTTLRECRRIKRDCEIIEIDPSYCWKIKGENT